jgi:hypothetical protein
MQHQMATRQTRWGKITGKMLGFSWNSMIFIIFNKLEISKCPELKYKHINSVSKHQATRMYHQISLNHFKQGKSSNFKFEHTNVNPDFSAITQPFQVRQVAVCSAYKNLS